jgi:phosphinothricin acetyltransferase
MQIRDAQESDLQAIVDIYNAAIPGRLATADTKPILVENRLTWFREHTPTTYPLWVADRDRSILGWLSFQPFYGRPAYAATAELSIYIAPQYHRQGVGRQLLQKAIGSGSTLGFTTLLGFIFAHNQPSLSLFKSFDFQCWGHLPDVAKLDEMRCSLMIMGRHIEPFH